MKIVSLAVSHFRGLDQAEIVDLAPDLNLIVGPNESGKSRLFQALRYALFERYKGESEDKKALRTWGGSDSPRVVVTFEARGTTWRLEKQFLKQAFAKLEGGGRTLSDDDAEARVRELWGTRPIVGKKNLDEFLGLWPLLWVKQGDATRAPHGDFNDDARSRLRDALASQVNEVAAGPHGERVMARAERERERYWTATWKETGELSAARARKTECDARAAEALAARTEAHGSADELAKITRELSTFTARAAEQRKIVAASVERVERAKVVGDRVRAQRTEEARLRAESELAEQSVIARRETAARLHAIEAQLRGEADELREIAARRTEIETRATDAAAQALRAEQSLEKAQANHVQARKSGQRHDAQRLAETARAALANARAKYDRVAAVKESLAGARVDGPKIKRLRKAHESYTSAKGALAAASAIVKVQATKAIAIDGSPLAAGEEATFRYDTPGTIVIDGIATIDVRPGGADLDARRDAEQDARRELDALLAEAEVSALSEAEEVYARRTGLEAELRQAEPLLKEAAPAGIEALVDAVRARDAALGAISDASDPSEPGSESLEAAEAELQAARDLVTQARAKRDALKDELARFGDQTARREAAARELSRQEDDAKKRLAALPAGDALVLASTEARARWLAAADLAKALADDLARAGGAEAQLQLEQDRAALHRLEIEQTEKQQRKTRLEAQVDVRGGEELHDRVQRAESEAEQAARDLAVIQARALASRALVEALQSARREVQERLLAPVIDRVQPYLQALLPGARLRMDENWNVLGLEERDREEDFDALSGGAKEQVSILVRLGLAEVLAQGESLPIVLDDALVNTDDERHADMLRILYRASRKQQIILFSCHDIAWERLGESRRYALPGRRVR